jgi:hypothetical protein
MNHHTQLIFPLFNPCPAANVLTRFGKRFYEIEMTFDLSYPL